MKKQFLFLSTVTFCVLGVFAQTPFDNFAPEQSVKPMIELSEMQFKVTNTDTNSIIRYLELDRSARLLYLLDDNGSIIAVVELNDNDKKWLSVDPMSDKYPSHSPYNYCANNPLKFIDPDGRVIEIACPTTGNRITYTPGMGIPKGSSTFVSNAITGLNFLHANPEGSNNRVGQISNSEIMITVQQQALGSGYSSGYNGANKTLRWDDVSAGIFENGAGTQSPVIGLAHEIDHASKSVQGWETMYSYEAVGNTKSDAYYQSVNDAYMDPSDPRKDSWESSAINYENFIGGKTVDGKKISTYKRLDYISPTKQIKVESIFSIE